jgi:hypothetical protein
MGRGNPGETITKKISRTCFECAAKFFPFPRTGQTGRARRLFSLTFPDDEMGNPKSDCASPKGRKIVTEIINRFKNKLISVSDLECIAREHAMPKTAVRGWCQRWRAHPEWSNGNPENYRNCHRVFPDGQENALLELIETVFLTKYLFCTDHNFRILAIQNYCERIRSAQMLWE